MLWNRAFPRDDATTLPHSDQLGFVNFDIHELLPLAVDFLAVNADIGWRADTQADFLAIAANDRNRNAAINDDRFADFPR